MALNMAGLPLAAVAADVCIHGPRSVSVSYDVVDAAVELPCDCQGRCARGAEKILFRNGYSVGMFCEAVLTALRVGARRGANVACVGAGGCGKSTLLEPSESIFQCASKPEDASTFSSGGQV